MPYCHEAVVWSPDGRRLATSGGRKIKIWDASLGYQLASSAEYTDERAYQEVSSLIANGRFEEAVDRLGRMAKECPYRHDYRKRLARAFFERGHSAYHVGNYEQALPDLDQTIRFDPNHAEAYDHRGAMHLARGEWDKAIADYTEAIRLGPLYDGAYGGLAGAYASKGEFDKALAELAELVRREPDNANHRYRRAFGCIHRRRSGRLPHGMHRDVGALFPEPGCRSRILGCLDLCASARCGGQLLRPQ